MQLRRFVFICSYVLPKWLLSCRYLPHCSCIFDFRKSLPSFVASFCGTHLALILYFHSYTSEAQKHSFLRIEVDLLYVVFFESDFVMLCSMSASLHKLKCSQSNKFLILRPQLLVCRKLLTDTPRLPFLHYDDIFRVLDDVHRVLCLPLFLIFITDLFLDNLVLCPLLLRANSSEKSSCPAW